MVVWTSFCGDAPSGIVMVVRLQEGNALVVDERDQSVLLDDTLGPGVRVEVAQPFGFANTCEGSRRTASMSLSTRRAGLRSVSTPDSRLLRKWSSRTQSRHFDLALFVAKPELCLSLVEAGRCSFADLHSGAEREEPLGIHA